MENQKNTHSDLKHNDPTTHAYSESRIKHNTEYMYTYIYNINIQAQALKCGLKSYLINAI